MRSPYRSPVINKKTTPIRPIKSSPLDILKTQNVKRTKFKGTYLQGILGLVYFLKKYPNVCSPIDKLASRDDDYSFKWDCVNRKRTILPPRAFFDTWKKCLNNKKIDTIIVPLNLERVNGCRKGAYGHANYFIYSKKQKTIERFEPNGGINSTRKDFFQSNLIDGAFKEWFAKRPSLQITRYLTPMQVCPRGGFQDVQSREALKVLGDPGGFCAAWNLWYINLRLANPNKDPDKLVEKAVKALNTPSKTRTAFIRNYSQFIRDQSHKIFEKAGIKNITLKKNKVLVFNPLAWKIINEEVIKLISRY